MEKLEILVAIKTHGIIQLSASQASHYRHKNSSRESEITFSYRVCLPEKKRKVAIKDLTLLIVEVT